MTYTRARLVGVLKARGPVVYYVLKNGLVKIGFTSLLQTRMNHLQPEMILAIEPGTFQTEKERHEQFAEFRTATGEWFIPSRELMQYIETLNLSKIEAKPAPNLDESELVEMIQQYRLLSKRIPRICARLHNIYGWTWKRVGDEVGVTGPTAFRWGTSVEVGGRAHK